MYITSTVIFVTCPTTGLDLYVCLYICLLLKNILGSITLYGACNVRDPGMLEIAQWNLLDFYILVCLCFR